MLKKKKKGTLPLRQKSVNAIALPSNGTRQYASGSRSCPCDSGRSQSQCKTVSLDNSGAANNTTSKFKLPEIRATTTSTSERGNRKRQRKISLFESVKPSNQEEEKARFMSSNGNYNPQFEYANPSSEKTLLRFSTTSNKFLPQAIKIMNVALKKYGTYEQFEADTGGNDVTQTQFVEMFKDYMVREGLVNKVSLNVCNDMVSRGSMTKTRGRPTLNVRPNALKQLWVEGLLRHELGTHHIRSRNNREQPWRRAKGRKKYGLRPVNPTEEGLASLHSVLWRDNPCLWRAALLYYTTYKASLMSFTELYKDIGKFVCSPSVRWDYCLRAKRGLTNTAQKACFSKDQVYLTGILEILCHRHSIDFHALVMLGKVAYQDVERLRDHAQLDPLVVKVPFFMQDLKDYHKRLDTIVISNGLTDEELVQLYPETN